MMEPTGIGTRVVESYEPAVVDSTLNGEPNQKRSRDNHDDEIDGVSKKQKLEQEEEREHLIRVDEAEKKPSSLVKLSFISFAPPEKWKQVCQSSRDLMQIELINGASDQGVQWPDFPIAQQGIAYKY